MIHLFSRCYFVFARQSNLSIFKMSRVAWSMHALSSCLIQHLTPSYIRLTLSSTNLFSCPKISWSILVCCFILPEARISFIPIILFLTYMLSLGIFFILCSFWEHILRFLIMGLYSSVIFPSFVTFVRIIWFWDLGWISFWKYRE